MNIEQGRQTELQEPKKPSEEEIRAEFQDSLRELAKAQERTRREHPFASAEDLGEFVEL